jgi:hypothetical protein
LITNSNLHDQRIGGLSAFENPADADADLAKGLWRVPVLEVWPAR